MKNLRHGFLQNALLGCLLLAFGGLSRADIVQCINGSGRVTYTNGACEDIDGDNRLLMPNNSLELGERASPPEAQLGATERKGQSQVTGLPASRRRVPLDVETMRAAKESLHAMDRTSALLRRQTLAALEIKNRRWYNF